MIKKLKNQEVKHIFIIGSKGIPASYGGFETFVEKLTFYLQNDKNYQFHISCLTTVNKTEEEFYYHHARCFSVFTPDIGAGKAILYDLKALKKSLNYIKENEISSACIYILASRIGPFMFRYKKKIDTLGVKIFLNPDGHEWKRSKWNWFIKQYWKCSEHYMIKYSDLIICDSQNIERYIQDTYSKYTPKTRFIAYGAEAVKNKISEKAQRWLLQQGLKKDSYYLVVGRLVPENNYLEIIKEFMKTNIKKKLILVTTMDEKILDSLKKQTDFEKDERIRFVGSIYDQDILKGVRMYAYAYIHGHEVGGTNPSLLEAMSATKLNLLLDVCFNLEVGGDAAIYWDKDKKKLSGVLARVEDMDESERETFGDLAKKRMKNYYSWELIADEYKKVFDEQ